LGKGIHVEKLRASFRPSVALHVGVVVKIVWLAVVGREHISDSLRLRMFVKPITHIFAIRVAFLSRYLFRVLINLRLELVPEIMLPLIGKRTLTLIRLQ
jgi:hypothetical protein